MFRQKGNLKLLYIFYIIIFTFVILFDNLLYNRFNNVLNFLYRSVGIYADIDKYRQDFSVYFIDVGQGDAALITLKDKNILIDTGSVESSKTLLHYINKLNIQTIDLMIISHQHIDHIGGANTIINNKTVKNIMMPNLCERLVPTNNYYRLFLDLIIDNNINVIDPKVDNEYFNNDISIKILSRYDKDYKILNNWSIVLKITYKNKSFLFTGDCEYTAESDILHYHNDLKSDILKVAHHGSNTSSSEEFLRLVDPVYSVISVGKENKYGHPSEETLERIIKYSDSIFRTDIEMVR